MHVTVRASDAVSEDSEEMLDAHAPDNVFLLPLLQVIVLLL